MKQGRFEAVRGTGLLAVTALVCLSACNEKEPKPEPGTQPGKAEATRVELLKAVSSCVQLSADDFQVAARDLKAATAELAARPEAGTRQAARQAFHRAMDAWQAMEVMQIGPAAPRLLPGGAD
ncbi:MAG TPA: imelysin family protein, partial [Armatimonadota bacterium]|nr:imelysin family protein [Armatimonadota bacterium]